MPDLFLDAVPATPSPCTQARGNGFVNPGRLLGADGAFQLQQGRKDAKQAAKAEKKAAKRAAKAAKKAAAQAKKAAKKSGP